MGIDQCVAKYSAWCTSLLRQTKPKDRADPPQAGQCIREVTDAFCRPFRAKVPIWSLGRTGWIESRSTC